MTWKIQYIYKNFRDSVDISDDCTIKQLKTKIITSITNEKINYIDFKLESDFPIRQFGKLTINSGIFPRHWDQRTMSNFPNKLCNITIEIIPVDNYNPTIKKRDKNRKYILPSHKYEKTEEKNKPVIKRTFDYDIDFPPLGSG
jgi:hypothetical protein